MMKIPRLGSTARTALTLSALALLPALPARAADIDKANNLDNLDLTTSWNGGVVPGSTDNAWFDTSIIGTGANTYDFTSGLTWQQLRVDRHGVAAAGGSETIGSSNGSTLTLTGSRAVADIGTIANYLTQSGILLNSSSGATLTINNAVTVAPTSNSAALWTSSRNVTVNGAVGFGANTFDLYTAAGTTNIAGVLTGSGAITKLGTGELILGGNNTSLTSTLSFKGGTVRAANSDNALGSGAITVAEGTTLATASGGGARNLANAITINTGRTLTTDGGYADLTLSGNIGGAGGVTKASSGNVILSGTNSFTGGLTINNAAGALQISGSTNIGSSTITSHGVGGLIIKSGGTLTTTGNLQRSTAGGGNVTVETGGDLNLGAFKLSWNTATFKVDGTLDITNDLSITTNATTVMSGAGTINAGSFATGNAGTIVNFTNTGTMNVTGSMNLTASTSATFNQSAGTVNTAGVALNAPTSTYTMTGGRINLGASGIAGTGATKNINLGAGTVGASANWSSSLNMALTDASTGTTVNTLDSVDNTTARAIALSGNLTGAGSLKKDGVGTLTLSGANTYSGTTTVNGGTLILAAGAAIVDAGAVALADVAGATLQLNASETIGSLSGGGTTGGTVNLQANTLTAGNASNQTFAGAITGTGGAFTKQGTGTLTLSGTNTYTGATTVSGGRLNLTGSLTSATSVSSGATISGTGSTTGLLTTVSGASISLAGGGSTTSLTANGVTFANTAGGTTIRFLTTPLAATTYDVVTYGAGGATNFSTTNVVAFAHGTVQNNSGAQKIEFAADGAQTRTWDGVTGTWVNGGATDLWQEGDQDYFDGDNVVFNEPGAAATVTLSGRLAPGSITVNNTTNDYTFTGTAGTNDITGTTSLTKNNGGTLKIATQQSYTGGTTVNGGILDLTGGGGSGGTIRGTATVESGAILRLSTGDATGYGTGADRLSVINLNGGTLHVNTTNNQTLGSAVINMTGGSITGIAGSNIDFFANGSAINTLASATISTISLPSMNLRQNNTVFTVADGAATTDLLISANIGNGSVGNHTMIKQGAGLMALSGTNTYSGGTELIGGTLSVGAVSGIGTGYLAVKNGATFQYTGTGSETRSGNYYFDNGNAGIEVTNSSAVLTLWRTGGTHDELLIKTGAGTLRYGATSDNSNASARVDAGVLEAISSVGNNFANVTVNSGGTFRLGTLDGTGAAIAANRQIWDGGSVTVNAGGSFVQNGMDETISTLNLSGGSISGAGTLTVGGAINAQSGSSSTNLAGAAGLTKTTAGALTLTGANSYTGATTVAGGTLELGSTGTLTGTTALTVNTGGTLLLSSASESINDSAGLTLDGGTLAYATGLSGRTETLLSLTLSANSTLDFGTGNTNQFAFTNGITGLGSFSLAVWNWSGPVGDPAQDHLAVGGSALSSSELANVSFYSDAGGTFLGTGLQLGFGSPAFELVPVPEPTTALAGFALLGLAGCRRRRTQRVAAAG